MVGLSHVTHISPSPLLNWLIAADVTAEYSAARQQGIDNQHVLIDQAENISDDESNAAGDQPAEDVQVQEEVVQENIDVNRQDLQDNIDFNDNHLILQKKKT